MQKSQKCYNKINKLMKTAEEKQKQLFKSVKRYVSEDKKLLKKYGLTFTPIISFPKRRKLPLLSRFGIWLVKIQGGVLDIRFDKKEKK